MDTQANRETPPKKQGLAITSLVLGILSILICVLGILPGIPAVITGHVARRRARKQPDQHGGAGFALAGLITGYLGAALSISLLFVVFPALNASGQKARSMYCMSNLKQIGIGFRIWAGDNQDRFPFNVSTNDGGTLELCARGSDGFERDATVHFLVMSNELTHPRILVCLADPPKKPALNFANLQATNVSYQVRSGRDVDLSHPAEVLARCPIHGHELRCDGSVQPRRRQP